MKYNSVENAERFITEQVAWCMKNGYKDFTIWSNGEDLCCMTDGNDICEVFRRAELKNDGYWRAIQFVGGIRVEY